MASRSQIKRRREWLERRNGALAPPPPTEKPIEKMTVAELTDYAAESGIDLGGAKKKEDILAAITAAQQPIED